MNLRNTFIILTCLVLFPGISPSRSHAISIIQEKEIAVKFLEMIETQKTIVHDPIVNHLVTTVGGMILAVLPDQPFEYRFYVIEDTALNAFAGPAANIFFNTGLMARLATVDELAGILGHEIAHAASRHVSQAIDRSKIVSVGTLAGMLAGVLIGRSTDTELGQGISVGALALGQSAMLTFTRENETNADQKGFAFLDQTCFSPTGLLSGLMKIRASDWQGVEGIPDYFKTHPGTNSRIAHIVSLLEDETAEIKTNTCSQDFRYDMIRQRIIGLYENPDQAETILRHQLESDPENAACHYGLALVLARKSKTGEALAHLKRALTRDLSDAMILLEIGRIHLLEGNPKQALAVLDSIEKHMVMDVMITYYKAEARLRMDEHALARPGFEKVVLSSPQAFPRAYFHLADIYSREKKPGESHYYLGRFYEAMKQDKTAVFHYKRALETLNDADKIEKAKQQMDRLNGKKN